MNPQPAENFLLEQYYPMYIVLFLISVIVITILSFVIVRQSKRIKQLEQPRYGFLGKPILAVVMLGTTVFSYGIIFYANQLPATIEDVTAVKNVELEIQNVDLGTGEYLLRVIPSIEGREWDGNPELEFDIYWTIRSSEVLTEVELGVSKENPGGIKLKLPPAHYVIEATIFFEGNSYDNSVEFDLT